MKSVGCNLYRYAQCTTLAGPMGGAEILNLLEAHQIPLVPFFSLEAFLGKGQEKIESIAYKCNVSTAQMNLARLLHKSPLILPIPGATSLKHMQENLAAAEISIF